MASKYLGETVDFHGGGADLLFPHHECEIAQAEVSTGHEPFVRFWLHTAMVYHEGEKMSKSLGNLIMISDLLENWSADAIRLYLASYHYRESWSHDDVVLGEAAELSQKLMEAVTIPSPEGGVVLDVQTEQADFISCMDDDLDTPNALKALARFADAIVAGARTGSGVVSAQGVLREFCRIFGLRLDASESEARVIDGWNRHLERFAV
jgi:cysteinyl-tRNA synthetase